MSDDNNNSAETSMPSVAAQIDAPWVAAENMPNISRDFNRSENPDYAPAYSKEIAGHSMDAAFYRSPLDLRNAVLEQSVPQGHLSPALNRNRNRER